ncbi:DUF5808 domain-containing protein [Haloimpatiens sp. FM7330]|uniref:DUF5808 domain-containing protein n=1 Tax=Haloimpatiens sp. FM7330 TaxID=3298610 RepID=UPI0036359A3F
MHNTNIGNSLILLISFGLPIFIIFMIGLCLPYFQNNNIFFGITIPKEYKNKNKFRLKKLQNAYKKMYLFTCGIFSIICIFLLYKYYDNALLMVVLLFFLATLIHINYYIVHKKIKLLKTKQNWSSGKKDLIVIDTTISKNQKLILNKKFFWIPILIILLNLIIVLMKYNNIPSTSPTTYTNNGYLYSWTKKSLLTFLLIPFSEIEFTIFLNYIYNLIMESKEILVFSNIDIENKINTLYTLWSKNLLINSFLINLLFLTTSISNLGFINIKYNNMLIIMITFIIFIYSATLSFYTGKKLHKFKSFITTTNVDEDIYWLMGYIYYNPNDKRLWVPKRLGIGWTLNIYKPIGKIFIIVITTCILLTFILLSRIPNF